MLFMSKVADNTCQPGVNSACPQVAPDNYASLSLFGTMHEIITWLQCGHSLT